MTRRCGFEGLMMVLAGCSVNLFMFSNGALRSRMDTQMMKPFCVPGIHSRSPLWGLLGVSLVVMGTCSEKCLSEGFPKWLAC